MSVNIHDIVLAIRVTSKNRKLTADNIPRYSHISDIQIFSGQYSNFPLSIIFKDHITHCLLSCLSIYGTSKHIRYIDSKLADHDKSFLHKSYSTINFNNSVRSLNIGDSWESFPPECWQLMSTIGCRYPPRMMIPSIFLLPSSLYEGECWK